MIIEFPEDHVFGKKHKKEEMISPKNVGQVMARLKDKREFTENPKTFHKELANMGLYGKPSNNPG